MSDVGYVASHNEAERRIELGQKQYQCLCCDKWHWWNERKGHTFKKPHPSRGGEEK